MGKAILFHNHSPLWWDLIKICKNLTDFRGNFILPVPRASRTCWLKKEETLKWGEQTSHKVSLPQTQRERSQQGNQPWDSKVLCSGEEAGKEQMTSNCPALSALYKSKTIPRSATQILISFPGLNITSQTALWHSVHCQMFLSLSLSAASGKVYCGTAKWLAKKFHSIIYYGTLMFYWMKPSVRECFPTLWARSRIYCCNIACLREFHNRDATQCITDTWDSG